MKFRAHQRQRGMTMFVALVMLVLITLLAMSTFNLGKSSIQVVNNMQNRDEGIASSRRVLDEAMSSTRFFDTPADALANRCNGVSNTRCIDINGDGVTDIVTTLSTPACIKVKTLQNSELDLNNKEDAGCIVDPGNSGYARPGSGPGNSLCAESTWEMTATSEDRQAQSKVEVVQGVAMRIPTSDAGHSCN